jgi:uncharacterized protein with GYD domain
MPTYLFEATYTSEGVRGLARENASSRRTAFEQTITQLGGQLEAFYYAFGAVDVYAIAQMPDHNSAMAVSLAVKQSAAMEFRIIVLLTPEEMDQAIAHTVAYRAPGL